MAGRNSGRGGRGGIQSANAWNIPKKGGQLSQSEIKFKVAKEKNEANLKIALEKNYESSSDEDDLEKNGLEKSSIKTALLEAYAGVGGSIDHLGRTEQHIENALQSGAVTCLICISNVKRPESIWSCGKCFCIFHLNCIRHWVRDRISLKQINSNDALKTKVNWACPNCRHEFEPQDAPTRYYCFCGKQENPQIHPWYIPHSCGDFCEKALKPLCGHNCLLRCHPGPCPPCPKTVTFKCYCGNQEKPQRCGAKNWTCGQKCKKKLLCSKHFCTQPCHAGECMSCPKTSSQPCLCGSSTKTRPCASPQWQCTKVCGKSLDCGNHICEEVCHSGQCKPCPLNGLQTCPCGKTSLDVSCKVLVPTCGDTCDKLLECGAHYCIQRCHHGKCGLCLERTVKSCRCGYNQKEIPCVKTYLCDRKCQRTKNCGKHSCNRKCCDGRCLPCDKACGKTLSCHNHKCLAICHEGPCFPCMVTIPYTCRCGGTKIEVPCGTKKKIKPPQCRKQCKLPSPCHHNSRKHTCHYGYCPPCQEKCNLKMKCGHHCKTLCHSAVVVEVTTPKGVNKAQKKFPCGECSEPVVISCLGGHEKIEVPCKDAKTTSCGRPCGALLNCTNHVCSKPCHDRNNSKCDDCERRCSKLRPEGCTHPCLRTCHKGPCSPCNMLVKVSCHCNFLTKKYIDCIKWCAATEEEKSILQSCGGQCPKKLPCGHPCSEICHAGDCPNAKTCRKRSKVYCPCNRIKNNMPCDQIKAGKVVNCDEICEKEKLQEKLRKEKEEAEKEAIKKAKEEEELRAFEKKMSRAPRKRNDTRKRSGKESRSLDRYQIIALGLTGLSLAILLTYYVFVKAY